MDHVEVGDTEHEKEPNPQNDDHPNKVNVGERKDDILCISRHDLTILSAPSRCDGGSKGNITSRLLVWLGRR